MTAKAKTTMITAIGSTLFAVGSAVMIAPVIHDLATPKRRRRHGS